jgi:hypothetical protein
MKKSIKIQKLAISKETISLLKNENLKFIKGGEGDTFQSKKGIRHCTTPPPSTTC